MVFSPDPWLEVTNVHWKRPTTDTEPPVTETEPMTGTGVPDLVIRTERVFEGVTDVTETIGYRRQLTHPSNYIGEIVEGSTVFDVGLGLNELSVYRYTEVLFGASPSTVQTISFVGNVIPLLVGKEVYINDELFLTFPAAEGDYADGAITTSFHWRSAGGASGETYVDIYTGVISTGDPPPDFLYDLAPGTLYTITTRDPGVTAP